MAVSPLCGGYPIRRTKRVTPREYTSALFVYWQHYKVIKLIIKLIIIIGDGGVHGDVNVMYMRKRDMIEWSRMNWIESNDESCKCIR